MKAIFKIQKANAKGGWLIDHTTDEKEGFQWQPFTFTAKQYIAKTTLKFFGMKETNEKINTICAMLQDFFREDGEPSQFIIEHSELNKL